MREVGVRLECLKYVDLCESWGRQCTRDIFLIIKELGQWRQASLIQSRFYEVETWLVWLALLSLWKVEAVAIYNLNEDTGSNANLNYKSSLPGLIIIDLQLCQKSVTGTSPQVAKNLKLWVCLVLNLNHVCGGWLNVLFNLFYYGHSFSKVIVKVLIPPSSHTLYTISKKHKSILCTQ